MDTALVIETEDEERPVLASACPRPRDKRCRCEVHQSPPRCWGAQVW